MANAGFNTATDLFNMGSAWEVKSSNINPSNSVAGAPNFIGDITHRDAYGERIAPSAEYVLVDDTDKLPALGTVVTIDGKKVAISSISVKTSKGEAPTATVTGTQVEDDAPTVRTYSCGDITLSARHRAQDIVGYHGSFMPSTINSSTFNFTCDVTLADPKGVIESSDCSNGKIEAQYEHVSGDGASITAPAVSGTAKVVSAPAAKGNPENDYVTVSYSITDSLTGSEPSK